VIFKHWVTMVTAMVRYAESDPGVEILAADDPACRLMGFVLVSDRVSIRWEWEIPPHRIMVAHESFNIFGAVHGGFWEGVRSTKGRIALAAKVMTLEGRAEIRRHLSDCPECLVLTVMGD